MQTGEQDDTVSLGTVGIGARLAGGNGNDKLTGGNGDDTLRGEAGADTVKGGAGHDTADYSDRANPLTISMDDVAGDGEAGENDNVGSDVEVLVGGSGPDVLTGNAADNTIYGNAGDDVLGGRAGADTLGGGDGNDTLSGGDGADVLQGNDGIDTTTYADAAGGVRVTLDGKPGDGAAGENDNVDTENASGSPGDDVLIGNAGANLLDGGDGNDRILGGAARRLRRRERRRHDPEPRRPDRPGRLRRGHRRGRLRQARRPDRLRIHQVPRARRLFDRPAREQGRGPYPRPLLAGDRRGLPRAPGAQARPAHARHAHLPPGAGAPLGREDHPHPQRPRAGHAQEADHRVAGGARQGPGRGHEHNAPDHPRSGLMRAVVQRVEHASVLVEGETVALIASGLLVLLGVGRDDDEPNADRMAEKLLALRIFEDDDGKMNRSVTESSGEILCVSNFTVQGDTPQGKPSQLRRGSAPERAKALYERVRERLGAQGGAFGEHMEVELLNDGPVTLVVEL